MRNESLDNQFYRNGEERRLNWEDIKENTAEGKRSLA